MSFLGLLCLTLTIVSSQSALTSRSSEVTGNVCTFRYQDKFFSLVKSEASEPYKRGTFNGDDKVIQWNFCVPFKPWQCANKDSMNEAFAFLIEKQAIAGSDTLFQYNCVPYTSDSTIGLYSVDYQKEEQIGSLILTLNQKDPLSNQSYRKTVFTIQCSPQNQQFQVEDYKFNDTVLEIKGKSVSGCPLASISSLWRVLNDNLIIVGIVLFVVGLNSLFFGREMLVVTIFVAAFFISFIVLGGIFTLFLTPSTSSIVVYFALIFLLFASVLVAYGATTLVDTSIVFIGAFLGFILGALVNTIFSKMFGVYSVWSLVVFDAIFMITCGLLTFKYADIIVILSTSLTGAYLVVRPISWIFGGFPNELLLEQLYQSGELNRLPWAFFIYLIMIVGLAFVGASYQFLKLKREDPNQQIEVGVVGAKLQRPVDNVKGVIDQIIERFKSDSSDEYRRMHEQKAEMNSTPNLHKP